MKSSQTIVSADGVKEQSRSNVKTRSFDVRSRADGRCMQALSTPGHIGDAHGFVMTDRVFTGDTLLIRGTGRTDFQSGDPTAQYDGLFSKLLSLPEDTLVYPAHHDEGRTRSIGEEKRHTPRLQVVSRQAYIEQMNALQLDPPRLFDVAVPANRSCALPQAA